MRTFKWEPWFSAEEETSIAHTWISFLGLALNFYNEPHLFSFASAVGKPLAIDVATKNKTRPSCARVKVEIDLLNEHPTKFQIRIEGGRKLHRNGASRSITGKSKGMRQRRGTGGDKRKPNKNRKPKQPSNPPINSGVNTGTVIPAVLAIGNTVSAVTQPIATQNPTDQSTGNPSNSAGNQRITADSPMETLAVIPENPTQITNPIRPGNPSQMLTHPTSSAHVIGNPTAPDKIHWAPGLPKTRSGKIMRRILRKIASRQLDELGDTSTRAYPTVVDQLIALADC
ncbi:hypothetical protein RND71_011108 [Anisodus tanguticus]|uniref:DUF4283 domain-containing protein n=1 Tax=Anisodus tanguticus TaxID=243964 RepID=A0AAE1VKK3_9SOLA|nr:hypothetical protein RND71_011108 [Anisodus tanguticus]